MMRRWHLYAFAQDESIDAYISSSLSFFILLHLQYSSSRIIKIHSWRRVLKIRTGSFKWKLLDLQKFWFWLTDYLIIIKYWLSIIADNQLSNNQYKLWANERFLTWFFVCIFWFTFSCLSYFYFSVYLRRCFFVYVAIFILRTQVSYILG